MLEPAQIEMVVISISGVIFFAFVCIIRQIRFRKKLVDSTPDTVVIPKPTDVLDEAVTSALIESPKDQTSLARKI